MRYIIAEEFMGSIQNELEITESEYNEVTRIIRKKRAEKIQQLIKESAQTIGVVETKSMIREILREL